MRKPSLRRRRRDAPPWAEPGYPYRCNDDCGYVFTLQRDGTWEKTGKGYDRTIQSWAQLEDQDGDCSVRLERVYGGQWREDQARAKRFPRRTVTCQCRGLSPHLHYRGRRWFS
jgi:hypothetical protein